MIFVAFEIVILKFFLSNCDQFEPTLILITSLHSVSAPQATQLENGVNPRKARRKRLLVRQMTPSQRSSTRKKPKLEVSALLSMAVTSKALGSSRACQLLCRTLSIKSRRFILEVNQIKSIDWSKLIFRFQFGSLTGRWINERRMSETPHGGTSTWECTVFLDFRKVRFGTQRNIELKLIHNQVWPSLPLPWFSPSDACELRALCTANCCTTWWDLRCRSSTRRHPAASWTASRRTSMLSTTFFRWRFNSGFRCSSTFWPFWSSSPTQLLGSSQYSFRSASFII